MQKRTQVIHVFRHTLNKKIGVNASRLVGEDITVRLLP